MIRINLFTQNASHHSLNNFNKPYYAKQYLSNYDLKKQQHFMIHVEIQELF